MVKEGKAGGWSLKKKKKKKSDIFHISAQNIDCGCSLELQFMFLSRNKKNNVYPCKPKFYYIKVGFKGSKLYRYDFVMDFMDINILAGHVLCLWFLLGIF